MSNFHPLDRDAQLQLGEKINYRIQLLQVYDKYSDTVFLKEWKLHIVFER